MITESPGLNGGKCTWSVVKILSEFRSCGCALHSQSCNLPCEIVTALLSLTCSNKESDPEKYVLKLKIHRAGVKKCQYSGDGNKVISCSNDSGLKVCKTKCLNIFTCCCTTELYACTVLYV